MWIEFTDQSSGYKSYDVEPLDKKREHQLQKHSAQSNVAHSAPVAAYCRLREICLWGVRKEDGDVDAADQDGKLPGEVKTVWLEFSFDVKCKGILPQGADISQCLGKSTCNAASVEWRNGHWKKEQLSEDANCQCRKKLKSRMMYSCGPKVRCQ